MQKIHLLLLLLFFSVGLSSNDKVEDKIAIILEETKVSFHKEKEGATEEEKKRSQASAVKLGETKLNRLRSFYLERHLFADANKVKDALDQFKKTDFSTMGVAKSAPVKDASREEPVDTPKVTSDVPKVADDSPARRRTVDFNSFKAMGENEKQALVDRFVTQGSDGFWTVSQGRYTVNSDVSAMFTLEQAIQMSDFYNAFERIFKKEFKTYSNASVYITKTRASFFRVASSKGLSLPPWSGGVYSGDKRMMFAYLESGAEELKETLYHEGTHQLLHYNTGRSLPPWLNEGLATNFETWEPTQSERFNTFEAQFKSRYLGTLVAFNNGRKLTKEDFKSVLNMDGWRWNGSSNPEFNYSRAWSIINFFLSSAETFKYLDLIYTKMMNGAKIDKILSETEMDKLAELWLADIEKRQALVHKNGVPLYNELMAWVKTNKYKKKVAEKHLYELGKDPSLLEYKYMEAIHYAAIGDFKEATPRLEALSKLDRTLPFVHSTLGYCYKELGRKTEASTMFLSASRFHSADPIVARCQ